MDLDIAIIVPIPKIKDYYSKTLTCDDLELLLSILYCLKYLNVVLLNVTNLS